eukprot:GHRQ01018409.1.p3 GENE.GHRQ01018409.1~~GHRQ01018409.1.p3  ORF type:complete len:140 (-),score=55.82 GHRQ01018409.1:48-467(-)
MLKFGVVLDGTMLEAVTRSTTGINGSSEGIVAVLVASDTATALNVSLGRVQVLAVQQISNRQLLVNVTATVPVDAAAEAAAAAMQDLSAGEWCAEVCIYQSMQQRCRRVCQHGYHHAVVSTATYKAVQPVAASALWLFI